MGDERYGAWAGCSGEYTPVTPPFEAGPYHSLRDMLGSFLSLRSWQRLQLLQDGLHINSWLHDNIGQLAFNVLRIIIITGSDSLETRRAIVVSLAYSTLYFPG